MFVPNVIVPRVIDMDHVWFSLSWTFGVLSIMSAFITGSGLYFFGGWMILLMNEIRHHLWLLTEPSRLAKAKLSDVERAE